MSKQAIISDTFSYTINSPVSFTIDNLEVSVRETVDPAGVTITPNGIALPIFNFQFPTHKVTSIQQPSNWTPYVTGGDTYTTRINAVLVQNNISRDRFLNFFYDNGVKSGNGIVTWSFDLASTPYDQESVTSTFAYTEGFSFPTEALTFDRSEIGYHRHGYGTQIVYFEADKAGDTFFRVTPNDDYTFTGEFPARYFRYSNKDYMVSYGRCNNFRIYRIQYNGTAPKADSLSSVTNDVDIAMAGERRVACARRGDDIFVARDGSLIQYHGTSTGLTLATTTLATNLPTNISRLEWLDGFLVYAAPVGGGTTNWTQEVFRYIDPNAGYTNNYPIGTINTDWKSNKQFVRIPNSSKWLTTGCSTDTYIELTDRTFKTGLAGVIGEPSAGYWTSGYVFSGLYQNTGGEALLTVRTSNPNDLGNYANSIYQFWSCTLL